MTGWLLETLFWTAILIGFVLCVRRPVARWFGPQIAYALWLIPALRLILPPIELPASMAPAVAAVPAAAIDEAALRELEAALALGALQQPAAQQAETTSFWASLDWTVLFEAAFAIWLIGAGLFLILRFSAYFRLRDDLLHDGREVGRDGKVRLIETPGTTAPLAFGVIDKVIALPLGFMAQPDRTCLLYTSDAADE